MVTLRLVRTLLLPSALICLPLTAQVLAAPGDTNIPIVDGMPILLDGDWLIIQTEGVVIPNDVVIGGSVWIFERSMSATPPFPYRTETDSYYTVKPSKIDSHGYTATFSGDITGRGPTVYTGGGTLILTGTVSNLGSNSRSCGYNVPIGSLNVYCTIVSSPLNTIDPSTTVQIGNGGTSGSLAHSILNNGTLVFDRGGSYTYDGVISGTGAVQQTGSAAIFTGNNTYTGGTTISAGTLYLGNGGTSGWITGDVVNNGVLAFNHSDAITFGGVISGTGGVNQIGGGTLVLTGANAYSGTTAITTGVLEIGNGGTTGAIVGNVDNNGTLVFNRADTFVFGGTISGNGTLKQIGAGTLIVTGANTLSGATIVSFGTLQVGSGGTSGSIAGNIIDNASLVFDRSGITAVAGDISGTGTLRQNGVGTLVLNGTNTYTGLTTVATGMLSIGDVAHPSARIAGNVVVNQGAVLSGHGTVGGTITNNGGTVMPGGSIGTLTVSNFAQEPNGTLTIEVGPTSASSLAVTDAALLNGTLNLLFDAGPYDFQRVRIVSAGSVSGRFTVITSNNASVGAVYGITFGSAGIDAIVQPTSAGQIYSDLIARSIDEAHALSLMVLDHIGTDGYLPNHPTTTVWARGFGGGGSSDGDANRNNGNWSRWAGLMLGADYHLAADTRIGIAFSYSQSGVNTAGGKGKALGNSFSLTLNGGMPIAIGRIEADLFYKSDAVTSRRGLGALGIVEGHPSVHTTGGALQLELPLNNDTVVPFTTLSYAKVMRAASVESGVEGANFDVNARTYSSLRWYLGLRLQHDFAAGRSTVVRPQAEAGFRQELNTMGYGAAVQVTGMGESAFVPPYAKPVRSAFTAAIGVGIFCSEFLAVSLRVDGWTNARERAGLVALTGRIVF